MLSFGIALVCFFWTMERSEWGKDVPDMGPDEADRVHNPAGFSIVIPRAWSALNDLPGFIGASPKSGVIPRRYTASIHVLKLDGAPQDAQELVEIDFQGQPAFERTTQYPGGNNLEAPPQFHYALVFERGGSWYELGYAQFSNCQSLPAIIREYFNSFQIETTTVTVGAGPGASEQ